MFNTDDLEISPQTQGICVMYSVFKSISLLFEIDFLSVERAFIQRYNLVEPVKKLDELCKSGLEALILLTRMKITMDAQIRVEYPSFNDVNYKFLVEHFVKSLPELNQKIIKHERSITPGDPKHALTILLSDLQKQNMACVSLHNDDVTTHDKWKCHCFMVAHNGKDMMVIDPNTNKPYPLNDLLKQITKYHFGDGIYLELS